MSTFAIYKCVLIGDISTFNLIYASVSCFCQRFVSRPFYSQAKKGNKKSIFLLETELVQIAKMGVKNVVSIGS